MLYLDTSALAKLYVIEAGSSEMKRVIEESESGLFTSRVTYAETLSLLARLVRESRISRSAGRRQKEIFLRDWNSLHIVEVTPSSLASADRIIERHGLRGFDTVHLCAALSLGRPDFACFDARLRIAADAEGLVVIPPAM